jgi:succinate dehydrogenase / fumarate reductase cytochrome b subunit
MTEIKASGQANLQRPTSPHLQIYKWNVSSLTSIMHRATGVVLYLSVVAICWYIVYYTYQVNPAESVETCDCPMQQILNNIFCLTAIAVTFSLYYHFCNGIRHLFWDIGKGFEIKDAKRNGYLVIFCALAFTAATFGAALYLKLF